MSRVRFRNKDINIGSERRFFWLKIALALAFLGGFLLSIKLWLPPRSYPLTPISERLPEVPSLLSSIWFASLLFLLVAIALTRRPRRLILIFVVLAGLLSLFDQSRWQPWFYQYLFMFAALAAYPWGEPNAEKKEAALNVCRLIVVGTYFWSGFQKLNATFVETTYPWLTEPLIPLLPGSLEGPVNSLGIALPFIEASIGIGLLTRFRNVAVIMALGMHAFILLSIGPFGHDWNTIVWPWNIAMMVFVVILFWRTERFSARDVLIPRTLAPFHGLVLILFGVMPLFSYFGFWDSYLSMSLYSGNIKDARIQVHEAVKDKLPETIRDFALKSGANNTNIVSITDWSFNELNVPPYPENRIYKNVARHVCGYANDPSRVTLLIREKPHLVDGSKEVKSYDCSGLETGEHKTKKLE